MGRNFKYPRAPGTVYGRLTLTGNEKRVGEGRDARYLIEALCECGNTTWVYMKQLGLGKTRSCGCLYKESIGNIARTHAGSGTRLHSIWKGMRKRCNNPKEAAYIRYGAKGIKVCDAWNDFATFRAWAVANGYTEELTIERRDNSKGYEPENCTWIPLNEQGSHTSKCNMLTIFGETKTMRQWSSDERCKVAYDTLKCRLNRASKWTAEEALTTPSLGTGGKRSDQH